MVPQTIKHSAVWIGNEIRQGSTSIKLSEWEEPRMLHVKQQTQTWQRVVVVNVVRRDTELDCICADWQEGVVWT